MLSTVVDGSRSVFFTGPAGTGKSFLLGEIIHRLQVKYRKEPGSVAITASTGLAATNIHGMTLHNFAGIPATAAPATTHVKYLSLTARQRWRRTRVLIIDEVSMVDAGLFDRLEELARLVRDNPCVFGGIQLVITGDFFQLPPVSKVGFAFEARSWPTSLRHTILLRHVFRQRDSRFTSLLAELRYGRVSPSAQATLSGLSRPLSFSDQIRATELYAGPLAASARLLPRLLPG